jgi:hypothetical protein
MLCLGMGGDPLPHASLRGSCAEFNPQATGSGLSRIGWPITIRPRLRTALLMICTKIYLMVETTLGRTGSLISWRFSGLRVSIVK